MTATLDTDDFLPAVGQGAIAIVARADDEATLRLLAPILDGDTGLAVTCERAFLRMLDGSCRTPIAGYAQIKGRQLGFRGIVLAPDGSDSVETIASGPVDAAEKLGQDAGRDLLDRVPSGLLDQIRTPG